MKGTGDIGGKNKYESLYISGRTGMKRIFCILLAMCTLQIYAQVKDSLALLPFTGGNAGDGDYIVGELARHRELRAAFSNKVTPVTNTNRAFMAFEQKFQRSGLTDADSIFELGKQLNASFVMAGYITKLSDRNLVIVSILDVESLQQIAGDYREYKKIEDIDMLIPEMAKKLAQSVQRDTSKLPGLSVPPFAVANGVNASDAQTLAQILACDIANGNAYAVLPRTDSLEKVRAEHERARSGETDQERVKRLGAGRNALYVLAGSVTKLGALNKFAADVLDIKDFVLVDGYSERYTAVTDGIALMPKLAGNLNGTLAQPVIPTMVRIEGGTFTMGSPASEVDRSNDEVQHRVTISAFSTGQYEVTQAEYEAVIGSNPSRLKGGSLPVENVSWFDAVFYCNQRSAREGLTPAYTINGENVTWNRSANGYRLPTEAEWEYACRAETTPPISTMPSMSESIGKILADRTKVATDVERYNSWGLYNMHGNVLEWCWDWYGGYSREYQTDPTGAASGSLRVLRGDKRSASRNRASPNYRSDGIGFRVVRP
ncbi:hypothetical protein AGMMS49944_00700 [Spirochaetia bacterium]|nr:hypothetical protein AGMMS49944_00700 [Spirochaetia bacterium]